MKAVNIADIELKIDNFSSANHNILMKEHITSPAVGRHSDCLVYVISGEATYYFKNGVSFHVNACDVFYLPFKSVYCFDILSDKYEVYFIDFNFTDSSNIDKLPSVFRIINPSIIKELFKKSYQKNISQHIGYTTECISILYEIYGKIIKSRHTYIPMYVYDKIKLSINYILSNYTDSTLCMNDILNHTNLSEGYYRKIFKTLYNTSPIDYIINLRVNYAKELLAESNLKINKISELSGFNNLTYFHRQFRKKTGATPSEFRKLCKKDS